jgi:hypothetical protein
LASGPRNDWQHLPARHAQRQPRRLLRPWRRDAYRAGAVLVADIRAAVTIGFIGGLTTYSTFNYETTRLMQLGDTGAAALNALLTIVGAFVAGWLGMVAAKFLLGR